MSSSTKTYVAIFVALVLVVAAVYVIWIRPGLETPEEVVGLSTPTPAPEPTPTLAERLSERLRGMESFPKELEMKLMHMIVSHHGLLENGSPVRPMTVEALLLHYIDNLDAQIRGVNQVLEKGGDRRSNWTEYVKLLDRFIYRGNQESE